MGKPVSKILALNVGSSSIKFALFSGVNSPRRVFEGAIERIGHAGARFWVKGETAADGFSRPVKATSQALARAIVLNWLQERFPNGISAIGHRVVHGGPALSEPQPITAKLIERLRGLVSFDPDHMPEEIAAIESFRRHYPGVPQIACFDTAFHHDLPRVAKILPIPRRYEARGVRRYGFHGLSYEFLIEELGRTVGASAASGRVVIAHLGSGASVAAVRGGCPIDTTMGLTPAGGVIMSTRSGDLDPGLVLYLARTEGVNAKRFNEMVNFKSGLLGVSETTSDMLELLKRASKDARAAEAVNLFCYQIKKTIGAYAAALGGLDTLIFAGGIGENAPAIRARICDGLGFLGIELSEKKNAVNNSLISVKTSLVAVRIMHTDEELMIARSVGRVLNHGLKK